MEESKGFIEKLQSLDGPAKNKVLIVATAVVMVIVIYFWLAYFNNLIAGVSQPAPVAENLAAENAVPMQTQAQTSAGGGSVGTWDSFKSAAAFIYGEFMNVAHGLSDILQAPRQYIVNPPQ